MKFNKYEITKNKLILNIKSDFLFIKLVKIKY